MKDIVGQTLGNYRIEVALGTGGMGQVFRGRHVYLERPAAVKVMHDHLASHPAFRIRFLQEAKSTAALRSSHIVEIYEFGEQDGLLYLIMEMMAEGTLSTLIRQHGDRQKESAEEQARRLMVRLDLVRQAAEGLAAAHVLGVIHRDIKPDNLLLTRRGDSGRGGEPYQLKISDFGLARLPESSGLSMGNPVGTPAYMSPEQCLSQTLDGRSDLYSLGVVLYEVLTGYLPFQINSFSDAMQKHVNACPPPPQQACPNLPLPVAQIIWRCLAKRPQERYQTGSELANALQQAINWIGAEARGPHVPPAPSPPQSDRLPQKPPLQVATHRFLSKEQPNSFQTRVTPATKHSPQTRNAGFVNRALIPKWFFPVAAILLAVILINLVFILSMLIPRISQGSSPSTAPTATPTPLPQRPGFTSFTDASSSSMQLNGSSTIGSSVLELTPAQPGKDGKGIEGSAYFKQPIDPTRSFQTQFQFFLHDGTNPPADGFSFVIQNSSNGDHAVGGFGSGLGIGGISPSVVVTFALYPSDQIGVVLNGDQTTYQSSGAKTVPFALYGSSLNVWIDYNALSHTLQISISQGSTPPSSPLLTSNVNIAALGKSAFVGFTGGTGLYAAAQDILSWQFSGGGFS